MIPKDEPRHSRAFRTARVLTLTYALLASAAVAAAALLIFGVGEHWWPTTILLFGPMWLLQWVLAGAGLAWLVFHRGLWLAVLLALSEVVLLMPVLGYQPPWPSASAEPNALTVRLVTWNIGGRTPSQVELNRLFGEQGADVVILQECRGLPNEPTTPELATLHTHETLGMCMLSRLPVKRIEDRDRKDVWVAAGSGAIVRYTYDTPSGPFTLTNVHLETPREGFEAFIDAGLGEGIAMLSAKNTQRYVEARLASEWTSREPALPRLVAGDFNTPPQSDLLRETWHGFDNCFGVAGTGFGHTKETRWLGVRIDHVLASAEWQCQNATPLDGFASDHRPLLAVVTLTR